MYCVGDKIVYPMYGAGVIEEIEERVVESEVESYYVINIPNGNLKIKLSAKKADFMGLRNVCEDGSVISAIREVSGMPIITPDNWNLRYKENLQKIRTGKLLEVAEVVRNLYIREKDRGLSGAEKKMLNNARNILISEIVYSSNINKDAAEDLLIKSLLNL